MKSRSRLEILTRFRSRRLQSRLHHWPHMIYFVLNAMATTAHHNQFMIELGKMYIIIFYMAVNDIAVGLHNSHVL